MTPEREKLVLDNGRLVYWVVQNLMSLGVPERHREELLGEARLALVEAADRFDKKRSRNFVAYAKVAMRNAMIDYLRLVGNLSRMDYKKYKATGEIPAPSCSKNGRPGTDYYNRIRKFRSYATRSRPYKLDVKAICRGLLANGSPVLW